jgi:hypothetical protein
VSSDGGAFAPGLTQQVSNTNCGGDAQRVGRLESKGSRDEENRLSGQDDWTQQTGGD